MTSGAATVLLTNFGIGTTTRSSWQVTTSLESVLTCQEENGKMALRCSSGTASTVEPVRWSYDQDTGAIVATENTNFCIDVPGGQAVDGNRLWIWECTGGDSQKWAFGTTTAAKKSLGRGSDAAPRKVPKSVPWMSNVMKTLQQTDVSINYTWTWREKVADWYAKQVPSDSSAVRHMVDVSSGRDSEAVRPMDQAGSIDLASSSNILLV